MWQMTAKVQSDEIKPDMEVHKKERCGTEFLHEEKTAPIDIHWRLQKIYEDQTVYMSTVR